MFKWIRKLFGYQSMRDRIENLSNNGGVPIDFVYEPEEEPETTEFKIPVQDGNRPITKCDHNPESPRYSVNGAGICEVCGKEI